MTGKFCGNAVDRKIIDETRKMARKIVWIPAEEPLTLAARATIEEPGWDVGVFDDDLIPVHLWCHDNDCGTRMSFDHFRFRTEAEMTMFLLKWNA